MVTILIPVLKQGYLRSQLYWLDQQTHRDFTVIVMDVNHHLNKQQGWITRQRSFPFTYLPLIHNINFPKRHDFSIKNNLALLAPTDKFLFLSDSHYITPTFMSHVADGAIKNQPTVFEACTVLSTAYDAFRNTVDVEGVTNHVAKPVFLFDRRTFFYILNGFDEALTYAADYELMACRAANLGCKFKVVRNQLYHIHHTPDRNCFGRRWRRPCEKCEAMFSSWKFDRAYDTGVFPLETCDPDVMNQMVFRDRYLGVELFQCPNCGFGGVLNPTDYEKVIKYRTLTSAPEQAFDGRTGRNLAKIYEAMARQCDNSVAARFNYLMTTY